MIKKLKYIFQCHKMSLLQIEAEHISLSFQSSFSALTPDYHSENFIKLRKES